MLAFKNMLTSDVGILSAIVLAVTLGMGAFYIRFFLKHMKEDAERAGKA